MTSSEINRGTLYESRIDNRSNYRHHQRSALRREHAFIKNPDKTYGLTELSKKFGGKDSTLTIDLAMLSLDRLDRRVINGETYYSLKKNAQI